MANKKKSKTQGKARTPGPKPLPVKALRWQCDPKRVPCDSTSEIKPVHRTVGQDDAIHALRFGLETKAPGQNIYVRGLSGTGRMTLVRHMLQDIQPTCPMVKDCCYVYNFVQPDRPSLITLPAGQGHAFQRRIDKLAHFVRRDLGNALSSDGIQARRSVLDQSAKTKIEKMIQPFEAALLKAGLRLVSFQAGQVTQTAIFPVVNEKPIPPEEFDQLHNQGAIPASQYKAFKKSYNRFENQLSEINEEVNKVRQDHAEKVQGLMEKSARWILNELVQKISDAFPESQVREFLTDLVDDVVNNRLDELGGESDFTRLYRVNVVLDRKRNGGCPIIVESVPTVRNLLGAIDFEFGPDGEVSASHMGIRPGSLMRADGGYLLMEVRDVMSEPGAWKNLVRTLRTGDLEIAPMDMPTHRAGPTLKPQPIKVDVKVILVGDQASYYLLDAHDPDFSHLFKVLADFGTQIPRNTAGIKHYTGIMARIAQEEQLLPFDRTAIAVLTEHGARVASRKNKLTTRFSRIADIAREAAYIAGKNKNQRVCGEDVEEAIHRGKRRGEMPARQFRELVASKTIRIDTKGSVVGQINGLAVMQAGPMVYGFPARISATIGPGTAGVINIEREAALSGAIHTKGFYILGGLMRNLLRTDHPLAFDASVAFEQSYGGIDGDSASGAEICCLLSALTNIPLRQDLAMTGAIDQMGNILAIGAVNEKIEGFFDACKDLGMTGTQGVIIPKANAGDLMLRQDVVDACKEGTFEVYAVESVHEALALFTGTPAGKRGRDGLYPRDTVLHEAVVRAREYWLKASILAPSAAERQGPDEMPTIFTR